MEGNMLDTLKNVSVYDFLLKFINNNGKVNNDESIVYTAKDLQTLYPKLFSKYKLDQAIKNDNLPFFKSGHERYFIKSEIERWIREKNNI